MKRLVRTLILWLVYIIGAPGAIRARQRAKMRSEHPRILLVRPDHLGDLVLTTPVIQAVRTKAPDAQIAMIVGPWSQAVVERHPALDRLLTCEFPGFQRAAQGLLSPYIRLVRTAQRLRREEYDLAINLRPDFWWGAALLYLAGIPIRIGYAIQPGTPFLTRALPFASPEHATISSLRLVSAGLQALGYSGLEEPYTPTRYPLVFEPTAEERRWVDEQLLLAGLKREEPIIVIHPGTGGAVKLWRAEGWSYIATMLTNSQTFSPAPRIVLTGQPRERALLEEIATGMVNEPLIFSETSVGQLAALLARAALVLGVDNGPLHLAVAQNRPTLQIFGPTDVRIFGPWGEPDQHIVLTSTHRCPGCPTIPCGRLDFSEAELVEHPCARLITEQQVAVAIASLLKNVPFALPGQ